MTKSPLASIYTMTVMRFSKKDKRKTSQRVWGWYPTFAEAKRAVLGNYGDMFESGYYQLAVIEEMRAGCLAMSTNEWWYEGTYVNGQTKVKKIEKPKQFQRIVHFSMG